MITLLEAVNRVLLDIGERKVSSISNPASEKAKNYLQDAVRFLASAHDWEWLYNRVTATSWLGDSFTLPTAQQIRGVAWKDIYGNYRDLQYIDVRQFDLSVSNGFYTASTANRPIYYTIPSHQEVRVNPYPLDAFGQDRVVAYIIEDIMPPTVETATFPVPDKYMQLVIKKADYYMAIHHLEDDKSAQFFDRDFNEMLHRYRVQENKTPTGGYTMYRPSTRRYMGGLY